MIRTKTFAAAAVTFVVIATGSQGADLVAHYPFTGSFDDASGYGNDGQVHGDVQICGDCLGTPASAACFDGDQDWIEVPSAPSLEPEYVTLVAAFFLNSLEDASNFDTFIRKRYLTNDNSYELGIDVSTQKVEFSINRGSGNPADAVLESSHPFELGCWYSVVGTYNGTELRLYVNGELNTSMPYTVSIFYDQGVLELGGVSYSGGHIHFVDGTLDELRVYDGALSESEIQALALPACGWCEYGGPTGVEGQSWGGVKTLFR